MSTALLDIPSPLAADTKILGAVMASGTSQADAFAGKLRSAAAAGDAPALRDNVKQLVAETFIAPMLKMARNDPFKTDLFHGGSGEDIFGQQLDQELTKRMGESFNMPFVETAYKQFARQMNVIEGVDTRA